MFAPLSDTVTRAVAGTIGTLVCAGLCLAGAAAPAQAETVTRTALVHYQDLNLASADGRATLDKRIRIASERVCASDEMTLASRTNHNRCIGNAISGAQAQLSGNVTASN